MGAVVRQVGVGWLRSITAVAAVTLPLASPPPTTSTLPGRYITVTPPDTGAGTTRLHVWVATSRIRDCPSVAATRKTRPSGITHAGGYSPTLSCAPGRSVHVLAAGSYSSGISIHTPGVDSPPRASTRPSGSVSTVGYQRG